MENLFNIGSGFLKLKEDVKILICHIFSVVDVPLTKETVIFCLQNLKIANFFDLSDAFAELIGKGILVLDEKSRASISEKGQEIYENLKNSLSDAIKDRVSSEIMKYVKLSTNIKENDVKIEKTAFGYSVNCSISGGGFDLMKISLFAPDIETALHIKKSFYINLEDVYITVLSKLMSSDKNMNINSNNMSFVI